MQNRKGAPDHFQNSGNMNNATEWKCRWLGKIQCTGILNENVTKKEWKWPGNMQRTGILKKKRKWLGKMQHRELVKIFKSWQVCDWLAKWIIMLRFMDLRWPRVFRRSNVGLVYTYVLGLHIGQFDQYDMCIDTFYWYPYIIWWWDSDRIYHTR